MEEALYEIASMRRFAGFSLGSGSIPDETTILNFRHLLEANQLTEHIFALINQYLLSKGLRLSKGTIVDASIIEAPSSTKNATGSRDPEMHQTKKSNNWHFGIQPALTDSAQDRITDQLETLKARVRAKVEHPFRIIKIRFGFIRARYRGMVKNRAQLHMLFALANLHMVRRRLMAMG
jgi:transposase, IS5 family